MLPKHVNHGNKATSSVCPLSRLLLELITQLVYLTETRNYKIDLYTYNTQKQIYKWETEVKWKILTLPSEVVNFKQFEHFKVL